MQAQGCSLAVHLGKSKYGRQGSGSGFLETILHTYILDNWCSPHVKGRGPEAWGLCVESHEGQGAWVSWPATAIASGAAGLHFCFTFKFVV